MPPGTEEDPEGIPTPSAAEDPSSSPGGEAATCSGKATVARRPSCMPELTKSLPLMVCIPKAAPALPRTLAEGAALCETFATASGFATLGMPCGESKTCRCIGAMLTHPCDSSLLQDLPVGAASNTLLDMCYRLQDVPVYSCKVPHFNMLAPSCKTCRSGLFRRCFMMCDITGKT